MIGLIKLPMSPLWFYGTQSGVIITHSDDTNPLVTANTNRLRNLNQSERKSHDGPISKAVRKKKTQKIVRP